MNRKVLAFVLCFPLVLMVVGCSQPTSSSSSSATSTATVSIATQVGTIASGTAARKMLVFAPVLVEPRLDS
jgi:ABC-type Zn uptake system ZnuABC Zn-binding protein ZnuA